MEQSAIRGSRLLLIFDISDGDGWRGAVYSDGQQTSALSCATVLDPDFCKVPPQLCDGSTLIHDICSSSSSSSSSSIVS